MRLNFYWISRSLPPAPARPSTGHIRSDAARALATSCKSSISCTYTQLHTWTLTYRNACKLWNVCVLCVYRSPIIVHAYYATYGLYTPPNRQAETRFNPNLTLISLLSCSRRFGSASPAPSCDPPSSAASKPVLSSVMAEIDPIEARSWSCAPRISCFTALVAPGLSRLRGYMAFLFSERLHTISFYTSLYYTLLYYTILYYTILYHTVPYYTSLYYTLLYFSILYSTPHNAMYYGIYNIYLIPTIPYRRHKVCSMYLVRHVALAGGRPPRARSAARGPKAPPPRSPPPPAAGSRGRAPARRSYPATPRA